MKGQNGNNDKALVNPQREARDIAVTQLSQRFAISPSHARLIASLQGYSVRALNA